MSGSHMRYFSFHIFKLRNVHILEATLSYFILKSFELTKNVYFRQRYLSTICSFKCCLV